MFSFYKSRRNFGLCLHVYICSIGCDTLKDFGTIVQHISDADYSIKLILAAKIMYIIISYEIFTFFYFCEDFKIAFNNFINILLKL